MITSIPLCDRLTPLLDVYIFSNHNFILSHVNSTGGYAIDFLGDRDNGLYLRLM